MKKILITSNLLLLAVILFMACNNNTTEPGSKKDPVKKNDREKTYEDVDANGKLTGLIDDDVAVMMSKLYKRDINKSTTIVNGTRVEDARAIWFNLDKIKLFIAKIEASVASASCKPDLGIRMYYAKYPESMDSYKCLAGMEKVAGLHTIFMTPTYADENGDPVDFDFENVGNNPCKPIPYAKLLRLGNRTRHGLLGMPGIKIPKPKIGADGPIPVPKTENHGGLMPPPAGSGSFPTGGEEQ